jgi:hypothetical protein
MNPPEAFANLLLAAMQDALREGKLTQLQVQLDPDGKGIGRVRLVVMPEKMEHEWPAYRPLGTPVKEN